MLTSPYLHKMRLNEIAIEILEVEILLAPVFRLI